MSNGTPRRSFTEEYNHQAVELVVSSGRSITLVAKELGPRVSVLRRRIELLQTEQGFIPQSHISLRMSPSTSSGKDQAQITLGR